VTLHFSGGVRTGSKIPRMKAFHSAREAKEFLISKIVAEAQIEGVPLSEVERKMLYFSETGWTLPDMMQVYDAFEREFDSHEYERKIAKLIRNADKHARRESAETYQSWWSAIRFLKKEDHYISVMVTVAGIRPAGDLPKLFLKALAFMSVIGILVFVRRRYDSFFVRHPVPDPYFVMWMVGVCVVAGYFLLGFAIGAKRRGDILSKTLEAIVRICQRVR
jgi:hypothetical protein